MIDIRINNQSLRPILAGPPKINDSLNSICRTLEFTVYNSEGLANSMGQAAELWHNGKRYFDGFMMKRGKRTNGKQVTYTAYDPMYYLAHNPNDFYFVNMTATQGLTNIANTLGIRIKNIANTGAVLPALYYQNADADKVAIDLLARTYELTGRKYWLRYIPDAGSDGIELYERIVPAKIWSFLTGINLESGEYTESIEQTITAVKLIERESGKIVQRIDQDAFNKYGPRTHFEEVNKDDAATMEKKAQDLIKRLSVINTTAKITGINPNAIMPQFYSGDVIYVQEQTTGLIGAYHILNVSQSFENDNLIKLDFDIQTAPDVPVVQFEDAVKKAEKKNSAGNGTPVYNDDIKKIMDTYGIAY